MPKLEVNGPNYIISKSSSNGLWRRKKSLYTETNKKKAEWLKIEIKAHHLLAQKLHDSTLTKLLHCGTVAKMWNYHIHSQE